MRAREREIGRRRPWLPDVLADGRPDKRVPAAEQHETTPGLEVAVLVEDAVVGQELLAVDRLHLAVDADGAGVEEVAVEMRRADERCDARRGRRDLVERPRGGLEEPRSKEQVLGRVAGDGQLGEEDEVGATRPGLLEPAEDAAAVAVEVADNGVDLGEGEAHALILAVYA